MFAVSTGFYRSLNEHRMYCNWYLLWQLLPGCVDTKNIYTAGPIYMHHGEIKKKHKNLIYKELISRCNCVTTLYPVSDCFNFLADENIDIY